MGLFNIFKRKPKDTVSPSAKSVSADLLPTYYSEFAKEITKDSDGLNFFLVAKDGTDVFEIFYYGNLVCKTVIASTEVAMQKVVAKAVSSGQEILVYDGFIHGYDNLAWQEHADADNTERPLKKLNVGAGRIRVHTQTLPDDEDEWEKDENGLVTADHGRKYKWEDFKRDAITGLSVHLVTDKGKRIEIIDEELA